MKKTLLLLAWLAFFALGIMPMAQAQNIPAELKVARQQFMTINKARQYNTDTIRWFCNDDTELTLAIHTVPGQWTRLVLKTDPPQLGYSVYEYYFWGNNLFYAHTQEMWPMAQQSRATESMYFLGRQGQLLRCLSRYAETDNYDDLEQKLLYTPFDENPYSCNLQDWGIKGVIEDGKELFTIRQHKRLGALYCKK